MIFLRVKSLMKSARESKSGFQPPEKTSDILRDNAVDNSVHNAHALSSLPRVKQQAKQLQSSCCAKLWC